MKRTAPSSSRDWSITLDGVHTQGDAASHAGSHVSSACPSGYTSKTTVRQSVAAPLSPNAAPSGRATVALLTRATACCSPASVPPLQYLKERLDRLEGELREERERRKRVEQDLQAVRAGVLTAGSRPITPADSH